MLVSVVPPPPPPHMLKRLGGTLPRRMNHTYASDKLHLTTCSTNEPRSWINISLIWCGRLRKPPEVIVVPVRRFLDTLARAS